MAVDLSKKLITEFKTMLYAAREDLKTILELKDNYYADTFVTYESLSAKDKAKKGAKSVFTVGQSAADLLLAFAKSVATDLTKVTFDKEETIEEVVALVLEQVPDSCAAWILKFNDAALEEDTELTKYTDASYELSQVLVPEACKYLYNKRTLANKVVATFEKFMKIVANHVATDHRIHHPLTIDIKPLTSTILCMNSPACINEVLTEKYNEFLKSKEEKKRATKPKADDTASEATQADESDAGDAPGDKKEKSKRKSKKKTGDDMPAKSKGKGKAAEAKKEVKQLELSEESATDD